MFGRIARLTLDDGNKVRVYTDLDIRFTVRNNCNFINDAKIDLLNPTREVLDAFTANDIMYRDSVEKRKVKLEIGWADEGSMTCIFDGVVWTAMPSSYPPDIWLSMTCIGFAYSDQGIPVKGDDQKIVITPSDVNGELKFSSVIGKLNDYLGGVGYKIQADVQDDILNKTLKSFDSRNKIREMMQGIKAIDRNLELFDTVDKDGARTIVVKDRRKDGAAKIPSISSESGMIGLPRCNWPYYYVETLLRTDILLWSDVSVESSFNVFYKKESGNIVGSMVNSGEFRVMGITYSGQLRAGKWSMTLDLLQKNEATKDIEAEFRKRSKAGGVNVM